MIGARTTVRPAVVLLGVLALAVNLRAALAGRTATPSVFDMMLVLGRDETLARLEDVIGA